MAFRTHLARFILALTVLAVAVAQAAGGVRGYLCVCGGETTIVSVNHCHGPHGVQCHDEAAADTHRHDGQTDDTEQHEVIADHEMVPASDVSKVILRAPALAPLLMIFEWAPKMDLEPRAVRFSEVQGSPPPSIGVVRSVVFLI